MTTKHTPGPWSVFGDTKDQPGIEGDDGTFSIIVYGEEDEADDCGVHGHTNEEMWANARLIAAAPDLLEALKMLKEDYYNLAARVSIDGITGNLSVEMARAAIAKAEEAK